MITNRIYDIERSQNGTMNKKTWKKKIEQATRDAGTYRPYFDSIIETLSGMMEMRDDAQKKFDEYGGESVIVHTNKNGQQNIVKNPALVVVDDINKTALAYWRDLGLTPAGLKRIDENSMKGRKNKTSFGDVLKEIGI